MPMLQDVVVATLAEMGFYVGVQDTEGSFVDLGMDLLDTVQLATKLAAKLSMDLTTDHLLECASVRGLAEHLEAVHGDHQRVEGGAARCHATARSGEMLTVVRGAMSACGYTAAADASRRFLEIGVDEPGLLKLWQELNTRLGFHITREMVTGCLSPQDLADRLGTELAVVQPRDVEPPTSTPSLLGTIEVVMGAVGYPVDLNNRGQTFSERGMDLLDLLRLRNGLSSKFGVDLARDLPLECQSAEAIAERLASDPRFVQVIQQPRTSKMEESPLDAIRGALTECGHAASGVSDDVRFVDLGLDTLEFSRVRRRLAARLAITLPATLLFDFSTVGALACHLGKRSKKMSTSDEAQRRPGLWNTMYGDRRETPGVRRTAQGFDALDSQELIDLQDGLLETIRRPEVQGRIQEAVRRCYPDKFRYILEVDELFKDVEGNFLFRWGLARSTAATDVRLARAGLQRCVAKFWRQNPEVRRRGEALVRYTKQHEQWPTQRPATRARRDYTRFRSLRC